jgi:S-adenosylmethionine:tRNA ribosyltransferase-isomerase
MRTPQQQLSPQAAGKAAEGGDGGGPRRGDAGHSGGSERLGGKDGSGGGRRGFAAGGGDARRSGSTDGAGGREVFLEGFGVGEFELPGELEATSPPEERGSGRDDVRLLVARREGLAVGHHRFRELPSLLDPGDVLVVNTSATLSAALDGTVSATGERVVVHFSTRRSATDWVVELRTPDGHGSTLRRPGAAGGASPLVSGLVVGLAGGARLSLLAPVSGAAGVSDRLWTARFAVPDPLAHLGRHGRPIRYSYTDVDRPPAAYQTVFAGALAESAGPAAAGSAEMPSAARPFTPELVTQLVSRGILVVPINLHTGVASAEAHEPPYAEWFEVSEPTVRVVRAARRAGSRVVAVGTTAARALESAVDQDGTLRPASGWTELVITPERGVRVLDGLLTGLHEPRASHLLMLEAVAGRPLLDRSYAEALRERYLWHEFGDLHLILSR